MKKMLTLLVLAAFVSVGSLMAADSEEGFVSLFNGKDLTGWSGDERLWTVEDGAIVGRTDDGDKKINANTFLIYDKPFGNFILRFDYWISKSGNSGLQYRSWVMEDAIPFRLNGYQGDFDGNATYSGIVYGEGFRGILTERGTKSEIGDDHQPKMVERFAENDALRENVEIEGWNHYEIIADGFTFEHRINGKTTAILNDNDTEMRKAEGLMGIQVHAGLGAMEVRVKNIRIKTL